MNSTRKLVYGRYMAIIYEMEASHQDCTLNTMQTFYFKRFGEVSTFQEYLFHSLNTGLEDGLIENDDQKLLPARDPYVDRGQRGNPTDEMIYGRIIARVYATFAGDKRGAELADLKAFSESTDDQRFGRDIGDAIEDKLVVQAKDRYLPAYAELPAALELKGIDADANKLKPGIPEKSRLIRTTSSETAYGRVIAVIHEMSALGQECTLVSMQPFYLTLFGDKIDREYLDRSLDLGLEDGVIECEDQKFIPARASSVGRKQSTNLTVETLYGQLIARVYVTFAREKCGSTFDDLMPLSKTSLGEGNFYIRLGRALDDKLFYYFVDKFIVPFYAVREEIGGRQFQFGNRSTINADVLGKKWGWQIFDAPSKLGCDPALLRREPESPPQTVDGDLPAFTIGGTTGHRPDVKITQRRMEKIGGVDRNASRHCGLESPRQTDDSGLPAGVNGGTTGHSHKGGATGHVPKVQFLQQHVEKTGSVKKNPCRYDMKADGSVKSDESFSNHQGFFDGGQKGWRPDFETFKPCERKNCGADLRFVEEVNVEIASPRPKVANVRKIYGEEGCGKMPVVLRGSEENRQDRECPGESARQKAREADGQNREQSEHTCKGCVVINVHPGAYVNMHFYN